jgi:AcrR family transcriptional regulator
MQDICERADLSPGAVYRYFKGKHDIIAAICGDALDRDLELIETIKTSGSAPEVMQDLAHSFLGVLTDEQVRLHLDMLAEAPRSDDIRETLLKGMEAIKSSFSEFVRAAQASGEVSEDIDPVAVARVMCALYNGYIVQQQIDPDVSPTPFVEAVMQIFEGGFFKSPQTAAASRRTRSRT